MDRRDLLRLLLATAAAEAVDLEKLLWTPKPIITVPAICRHCSVADDEQVGISIRFIRQWKPSDEPLFRAIEALTSCVMLWTEAH